MSVSRFRHTQATVSKPDVRFLDLSSSQALWAGSNMIACNELYVAVPWAQMGSVAVFNHQGYGRIGPNPPVLHGHEGAVIDVQFNPFDAGRLFTAGEDGNIMGWQIPDGGLKETSTEPAVRIKAHDKKCGVIAFHPSANNVLASAAFDKTVKIWDVEKGEANVNLPDFEDYAMDVAWNMDGSEICAVTRDRTLALFDARDGTAVANGICHDSPRALRCVWAKRKDQIVTFGWDNTQQRQMKVWDTRKLTRPISTAIIDKGSAAMMPMYDDDLSLLYVGFKGEGAIRAYELMEGTLIPSHSHLSSESVKGVCLVPKQCLNVKQCEIGRVYELTQSSMMTIHMNLPRKQCESEFQKDVYPPTFADQAAVTAEDFFTKGKSSAPYECDLEYLFTGAKRTVKKPHVEQRRQDVSGVRALKRPPKKDLQSGSAHADPSSNMVHETPEMSKVSMESLVALFAKQRAEVQKLRLQIASKEAEMSKTLDQIQEILEK